MNNNNQKRSNDKRKNIRYFMIVIAFLFFLYLLQLLNLQIFDTKQYKSKGERVITSKEEIIPERGLIYDRHKNLLAGNLQFNTAYISQAIPRSEKETLRKEFDTINKADRTNIELVELYEQRLSLPDYTYDEIEKLASYLRIPTRDILNKLENEVSGPIAFKVSKEQRAKVESLDLAYLSFHNQNERYYPLEEKAASTIGFVENGAGLYGLEKFYDDLLSGKKGYQEFYKAIGGTILPFEAQVTIDPGKASSIVTSLDQEFQSIIKRDLENVFQAQSAVYATAILTDPNTGQILAMESLPTFNANQPRALYSEVDARFESVLDEDELNDYMVDRWNNNNVSTILEPGSTFKAITTAIALDSNHKIEHNEYTCSGFIEIAPGTVIRCWRAHNPHGRQNLREAFSNSCNPAFVGIIDDIGKSNFVKYGHAFKFGEKTGIDLPSEVVGSFPNDSQIHNVDFRPMSYGHSLSTTPIHEIMALNATINGGIYYRPYLVSEILDSDNHIVSKIESQALSRVISEQSSASMREYFENNSLNSSHFKDDQLRIGHKTGTTEVKDNITIFKAKDDPESAASTIVSVYAAYPSNAPKYSMYLIVAYPTKDILGSSLVPVARDIFYQIERIDQSRQARTNLDLNLIKVPDVKDLSVIQAEEVLKEAGLSASYNINELNAYDIVDNQYPQENTYLEAKAHVELRKASPGRKQVPELINLTKERAIELLDDSGFKYKIEGAGKNITTQRPRAGDIIKDSDIISLSTDEN